MEGRKMNNRKWRNPYAPIGSKKLNSQTADVSLAVTPRKVEPAVDLRTSVSRMRSNIKGISHTIRQVEQTMDTLYGAMEMFESLGKKSGKSPSEDRPVSRRIETQEKDDAGVESNANGSNLLANIDIGQLLTLLQSPLVQNLLNQSANNGKRKKEG
jgi:translation initiation factor 2B subunit (eIF-2B alpha/beta/delta family)